MLFEDSLIVTLPQRKKGRVKFFVGTVIGYSLIVTALIVGSILYVHPQLNESLMESALLAAPPPPPPPPPPSGPAARPVTQTASVRVITTSFVPPTFTPRQLPDASDLPTVDTTLSAGVPGGVPGGVIGGTIGGVVGGVLGATPVAAAAPPPSAQQEAPPAPAPAKPHLVSSGILLGNTIRQVQPAYPQIARSAHIEGVVQVSIIVDEDGNVMAAEAINGHPLLQQAAVEAARQWKFRPTLLNGRPIKVSGVLKFTFKLT
jgi:protein TonB